MNKPATNSIVQIARKEVIGYFASPIAFIFLFTFLAVNLFIFFTGEAFFARNIADVRPLFEWMPLLLVFLVAALTMRSWSEERRMGTLEFLFTLPISTTRLVVGKFLACLFLVAVALLVTLPIPITVSFLGDLDLGPVIGGYIAALFLAGTYVAIGLFVSSRSDSQIVSLIVTALLCLVLYLIGSDSFTAMFPNWLNELLKLLGTGSRFDSITRGVLDIRDVYYYVSLTVVFLGLNVLGLERLKWSRETERPTHRVWTTFMLLLVSNFLLGNVWLSKVSFMRADLTAGRMYSISPSTKLLLGQLREPLLIRGYFSAKTHPLLAPLVPQIRDLIKEYSLAGQGRVTAEFIDPREEPDLEEEANRKYGIKPIPFQVSDKYQASLVNSYFDLVIQYGDKYEVLGFRDLIEVKVQGETKIDVQLRNPEYDITRAIRKVMYGFQGLDNLFANSPEITFKGYISDNSKLPEQLAKFKDALTETLEKISKTSQGKLKVEMIEPEANGGEAAKEIAEKYEFRPMAVSLFDQNRFYFYMLLASGDKVVQVPLPETLEKPALEKSLEAALKRFQKGFLKTIALVTPPSPQQPPWMQQLQQPSGPTFQMLQEKLSENYTVKPADLKSGRVPEEADILLLTAPKDLDAKQLFAVDQFLMRGGTVILASSPFSITRSRTSLTAAKSRSGLEEWLKSNGIVIEEKLVLDRQNEPYPVPRQRTIGAFTVEEMGLLPYPFFLDIRGTGLNQQVELTSGIPQLTVSWASPLNVEGAEQQGKSIQKLLFSSDGSWLTEKTDVVPNPNLYGELGFAVEGTPQKHLVGAIVEGSFSSFFKGKDSPLLEEKKEEPKETPEDENPEQKKPEEKKPITEIIEKSPASARIILYPSNEFLADQTLSISSATTNSFVHSLQIMENSVDWSLEDRSLLAIRSRGQFSRTLHPMGPEDRRFWEYLNYGLALLGLGLVYIVYRWYRRKTEISFQQILSGSAA